MNRSSTSIEATVIAGTARVTFSPVDGWVTTTLLYVAVTLSAGEGEARLYLGDRPDPGQLLFGTYSGSRDTADTAGIVLEAGDSVTIEWTGCTIDGATARAVLHTDRTVNRP